MARVDERHIVVGGVPRPTPFNVQTWEHHAMRFYGRSRLQTRAVMCHWTAAENPVSAMFQNMSQGLSVYNKASPLSVHFAVNQAGAIFQLADADLKGAHCRGNHANDWSVGIEFVGRGSALDKVPHKGVARPRVTEEIHGRPVTYDELLSPQIESGVQLIEWLCEQYGLPLRVPEDTHGMVRTDLLKPAVTDDYQGVLGHMHCEVKSDPGLRLLRAIQTRSRALSVA